MKWGGVLWGEVRRRRNHTAAIDGGAQAGCQWAWQQDCRLLAVMVVAAGRMVLQASVLRVCNPQP